MARSPERRHLVAFATLAEELHFGRAAERLFLTQPALTQTIRQLEGFYGVRLFTRTTRAVELSSDGLRLLPAVREALAAMDRIDREARSIARERRSTITVGYQIGTGVDLIPMVVKEFESRHPEYFLSLREYDFRQPGSGLDTGDTDVAFLRPPVDLPRADYLDLYREARLVGLPADHRLVDRDSIVVADLLDEPIIAAPGSGVWRDYWLLGEHRSRPPEVVFEAATFESELQFVAAGRGIIVTCEASRSFYGRPGVVFRSVDDLGPCRVALAWVGGDGHEGMSAFRTVVADLVANSRLDNSRLSMTSES